MTRFNKHCAIRATHMDGVYELVEDMIFRSSVAECTICVPAGFLSNGATIPRFLWWLIPRWGKYSQAAILHDYLYINKLFNIEVCDDILFEALVDLGVVEWKRVLMYYSVRLFGWLYWHRFLEEKY